ncbi:MAG: helix-turn-helix domain-containing protein [Porphyromonadaceae bacterium]|nr:helix-turn-helix domain-containing protein [Porphyromonadaceae bacterium]
MTDIQLKRKLDALERGQKRILSLLERQLERWVSVREAASIIGVSKSRVYALVRDGRLSSRRDTDGDTRGKTCIKQSSIMAYLDDGQAQ